MFRRIRMWFKSFKVETNFNTPITIKKESIRFESWEDAVQYMGKPVTFCRVEAPNVTSRLTGIRVSVGLDGEITKAWLQLGPNWHDIDYRRCRPATKLEHWSRLT